MSGGIGRGSGVAVLGIAARAVMQVVTVAITIVAARYLHPTEFGIFSLAAIATMLGRNLLYVGPYEYLMKSAEPELHSLPSLVLNVLVAAVFGVLALAAGWSASSEFGGPAFVWLLVLLVPSNLLVALTAWQEALVLRHGRVVGYCIVTIVTEIAAGVVTIFLLESGLGLIALVAQFYVKPPLAAAGFLLVDRPAFAGGKTRSGMWTIVGWSRHRYGAAVTNFLSNYAADFIIGALLSPGATGLFRTGSRLATAAADLFSQPANLICRTAFSRLVRGGEPPEAIWPDALMVFGVLALPALAGLAVLSDHIVAVVLGPTWRGAAGVVVILCFARAFGLLQAILSPLLVVRDRQRTVLLIQALAAAATVTGLLWSARFGLLPAAATVALVQGLVAAAYLAQLAAMGGLEARRLAVIVGILLVATAMVAGAAHATFLFIPGGGVSGLAAAVAAGVVVWSCLALIIRRRLARSLRVLR